MTTLSRTTTALGAALLSPVLALGLAACSGSGTTAADDAAASPAASSSATTPTAAPTVTDTATETPTPSASGTPTPAPTPTQDPTDEPSVIAYAGGESAGYTVHSAADAQKMTEAPKDFREFIGGVATQVVEDSTCRGDAEVGVIVQFVRTDGYAVGGVNDCGGYAALWADVDGTWQEIEGTQDSWDCRILKRYQVPSDIAGDTCYDYGAGKAHHYHQA